MKEPASPLSSLMPAAQKRLPMLTPRTRKDNRTAASAGPTTPALPTPPIITQFQTPARRILTAADHETFLKGSSYILIQSFVFSLADAVRRTQISAAHKSSEGPIVESLLRSLDAAEKMIDDHPPEANGGSRFGNIAFKGWCEALASQSQGWHTQMLKGHCEEAANEVSLYLINAFGSKVRLDYGSGHELNFIMWLLCFYQLNLIPTSAFPALTLIVFPRYLSLTRRLQTTYYLEPAGSHGLWGLDDYAFMPFLFGAAQLVDHPYLRPLGIHSTVQVEENSSEYLYFDQIQFINNTKTVKGLKWHSPMLDDISAAKSWAKIEIGMKKMFLAELLGKSVVTQHFLFGSLIPADPAMSRESDLEVRGEPAHDGEDRLEVFTDSKGDRHIHDQSARGDCCGIKVPSSAGATGEMQKDLRHKSLRSIPLD